MSFCSNDCSLRFSYYFLRMVHRRRHPLRSRRCHARSCEAQMIFDTVKSYARSQIPGFATGVGIVLALAITLFVLSRPDAGKDIPKPFVTPVSGAPAKVAEPRRDGDVIQYPLSYDAAGESILNVPIDSIPEAREWRHEVWSRTILYSSDGTLSGLAGYRYSRVIVHGGAWARIPRIATVHFRSRASPDAGFCAGITYLSNTLF